jgi:hypothetical protein
MLERVSPQNKDFGCCFKETRWWGLKSWDKRIEKERERERERESKDDGTKQQTKIFIIIHNDGRNYLCSTTISVFHLLKGNG